MATNSQQKKWEQLTLERIAEADAITYLGEKHPSLESHEHPNFKLYEFSPNKALDGKERYYLAGPEHSIIMQSSLLKAQHDIFAMRIGFGISFDEWFKKFSEGYSEYKRGHKTNYPSTGEKQWRKDIDSRPKYIEWTTEKTIEGHRVIEYFPEGFEGRSIVLSGSDWELKRYIQFIEFEGGGTAEEEENSRGISEIKILNGWPELKIKFWQKKLEKGQKSPLRTVLSVALIGFCEYKRQDGFKFETPLTIADLKHFKNKIEQVFYPGKVPVVLSRGKEIWSYQKWRQGYANWFPARNRQAAINIYQKLVQIKEDTFDPLALYVGKADQESAKYSETPKKEKVLNEDKELPVYRRNVELEFWQAWANLPKTGQKIMLVSRSDRTPVDERLMND